MNLNDYEVVGRPLQIIPIKVKSEDGRCFAQCQKCGSRCLKEWSHKGQHDCPNHFRHDDWELKLHESE